MTALVKISGFWLAAVIGVGMISCTAPHTSTSFPPVKMEPASTPANREAALERNLLATVEAAEKLGPANPLLLSSLHSLAGFYRNQGQYAKAEALYRRCLALKEEANGPDHPDVAMILEQYAGLLKEAQRPDDAQALERRAQAIRTHYNARPR